MLYTHQPVNYQCSSYIETSSMIYYANEWTGFYKKGIAVIKDAVMQIEKALINDCLRVSKVSWKFRIPTAYNFEIIHP